MSPGGAHANWKTDGRQVPVEAVPRKRADFPLFQFKQRDARPGPPSAATVWDPRAGPVRLTCQREAKHVGCHIDGRSPLHRTGPGAMARAVLSCCHDVIGDDVLPVPGSDHA